MVTILFLPANKGQKFVKKMLVYEHITSSSNVFDNEHVSIICIKDKKPYEINGEFCS